MEHRLSQQIDKVAVRVQRLRLWRGLTAAWLAAAAAASGLWAIERTTLWRPTHPVAIVLAVAVAALAISLWRHLARPRDARWLARRIEAAHPELDACLLTAIEQRPAVPRGRLGYLQESVVRQALAHAYGHTWQQVVPRRRIAVALLANLAAFALLVAALVGLSRQSAARPTTSAESAAELAARGAPFSFTVEPGNTEVERGTSLLVLARFQGPTPSDATLICHPESPGAAGNGLSADESADEPSIEPHRLAMSKSLDDPVFGGRIASVDGPLDYQVDFGGRLSETYHVSVFEYPRLVRADARLVYPTYTSLAERTISDVRTISAVEGTELTLLCHLNKPVRSAILTEENATSIELSLSEASANAVAGQNAEGPTYQATLRLEQSRRLKLHLVDDEGRENKHPVELVIHVLPNKPPDVKLAFPARDIEVSPLEESDVKATARDDYGLVRQGLSYTLSGGEPIEVVLGANGPGGERSELAHVIRFEELGAEPDQLLSYHFWAEDIGPAGDTRRVESDMYFAEVRHFEEIFRQGQQPPGGQQQQPGQQGGENAQAAEKLAQLQKDIISATWKLIRREPPDAPTDALADDAKLLHESQAAAIEQVSELADKLTDAGSKTAAATATRSMQEALDHLEQAQAPAVAPLRPALAAEQAAYQALLKLRAREHQVVRGQQRGGGGGGGGRSQQQLQQLQLSNDENRYESERAAQSQSGLQDRETRQVLSRLSELARRQNDINDRLKELNAALEEARTEPEREEARRQLKRLRDEQQQMLRDTDELRARMEQPENQERMSEARQQLDQTRDEVRRASEALDQEQVSQAAAAGARAEQDFQNLREDFRRQTSNRFNDEMREMRDDARQLDEREQEIGQRMSGEKPTAQTKSLRDEHTPENLTGELAEQRQRLDDMLDRMRRTIDEAEPTEPLLAERLYDTARKLTEEAPSRALEAAEQSLKSGLAEDARDREQVARKSIGELREGIEHAAESVLGDDTEALRRARQELERLSKELGDEIDRNSQAKADRTGQEEADEAASGSPRDRQKNGGQKNDGEQQVGQPRRGQQGEEQPGGGQQQDGQQHDGQQQDGQQQDGQQQGKQEGGQQEGGQQEGGQQQGGQQQGGQQQGGQQQRGQQGSGQPEGESQELGEQGNGKAPDGQQQGGQQQGGQTPGGSRRTGPRSLAGPSESGGGGPLRQGGGARNFAPLAGEDFLDWSDRLRDVEEMVGDPQLEAEAARIRERARGIRRDLKRHSQTPNWDLIKLEVAEPLAELRDRVAEELLRRTKQDALVPLDRDPVPPKYTEKTRRYYERLGSGER